MNPYRTALIVCGFAMLNLAPTAAGQIPAGVREDRVYAIRAARLIDGVSDAPIQDGVVVVRGAVIAAVGQASSITIPSEAEVIDLGDQTILPGLIDGHTHVGGRADSERREGQRRRWQEDNGIQMTRAIRHARLNLLAGITTCRAAGDAGGTDFMLRDAIEAGRVPGPRILPSGWWVSTTTGGTIRGRRVDGPWDLVRLIRNNIEDGATQIKLIIYAKTETTTNFTWEEIKAAVDEVHRHGLVVTAHASGDAPLRQAIRAGVDNIEHGNGLTEELIRMLVEKKIAVTSTHMAGYQGYFDDGWPFQDVESESVADWIEFMRRLMERVNANPERQELLAKRRGELLDAHRAGVPILVGLDNFHGLIALELQLLRDSDFSPMDVIKAGTSVASKAIGFGDKTGSLEPGKWADLISVDGDPLDDLVGALSHVRLIMVGGKRYDGLSYR